MLKKYKKRVSLGYKKNVVTGKAEQIRPMIIVYADSDNEADKLIEKEANRLRELFFSTDNVKIDTMEELVAYYYRIKDELKPTTISNDFNIWEFLKPYFGSQKPSEISHVKFLDFLEAKEKEGWGKATIHNAYKTMNKYLNFAVAQEFIEKNPLGRLKFNSCSKQPKPKKIEGLEVTIEQFYKKVFELKNTPTNIKFKVIVVL